MLEICGSSISKSLRLTFRAFLNQMDSPLSWKKSNVVAIHKKTTNNQLKTIGQFPFFQNLIKLLKYNEMFSFFVENGLISQNQSGSKPRNSCINQLLSNTHEIYKSFDDGWEVRGVFLDIKFSMKVYYLN